MSFEEHSDPEVRQALVRLADALCQWERNTGIESVLILRQKDGFVFRAVNGKPDVPDDIPDAHLMRTVAPRQ